VAWAPSRSAEEGNLLSDKDARRLAHEAAARREDKATRVSNASRRSGGRTRAAAAAGSRPPAGSSTRSKPNAGGAEEAQAVTAILANDAKKPGPGMRSGTSSARRPLPWLELSPREQQNCARHVVRRAHRSAGTHDYRVLGTELARARSQGAAGMIVHAPRAV